MAVSDVTDSRGTSTCDLPKIIGNYQSPSDVILSFKKEIYPACNATLAGARAFTSSLADGCPVDALLCLK